VAPWGSEGKARTARRGGEKGDRRRGPYRIERRTKEKRRDGLGLGRGMEGRNGEGVRCFIGRERTRGRGAAVRPSDGGSSGGHCGCGNRRKEEEKRGVPRVSQRREERFGGAFGPVGFGEAQGEKMQGTLVSVQKE